MSVRRAVFLLLAVLALPRAAWAQDDPLPPGAVARLGSARLRHAGDVTALAFSPDNKILASAGADHDIRLWDAADGRPRHRLLGHTRPVRALAFSPRENLLVSAGEDGTLRFWDPSAGTQLGQPVRAFSRFVAFSPDGHHLVFADGDFSFRVLAVDTRKEVRSYKVRAPAEATGVALSPDGRLLATAVHAGGGSVLRVWDWDSGAERRRWEGHRGPAEALAFTPDGKILFSGGSRPGAAVGELRGWDVATGEPRVLFPDPQPPVAALAVSADGKYLAASRPGGTTSLWDVGTPARPKLLWREANGGGPVAFRPDGHRLASAADRAVRLIDPRDPGSLKSPEGHTRPVLLVGFGPDGKTVVSAGERVCVWDAATGARLRATPRLPDGFDTAALSPDRKTLATASAAGTLLWDLAMAREMRSLAADEGGARALTFTPDGKFVVGAIGATPGKEDALRFWDVADGRVVRRFGKDARVSALAVSPDGKWLAGSGRSRTGLLIWDVATQRLAASWDNESARTGMGESAVCFSPDGKRLVAGGWGGAVRLFDPATRQLLQEWTGHPGRVLAAQFSPRGDVLATGDEEGVIRLWVGETGKFLYEPSGHDAEVLALAFSPDGTRLASASADTTVLVWDVPRLKVLAGQAAKAPARKELEAWWAALSAAQDDQRRAERGMRRLAASGGSAVAFLKGQLLPPEEEQERARRLIRALDDKRFGEREKAHRQLAELGKRAEWVLCEALARDPSLEARRRLEVLLARLAGPTPEGHRDLTEAELRLLRAAAVLARLRTPEADALLRTISHSYDFRRALAEAHAGTPPVEEVRAALEKRPRSGQ